MANCCFIDVEITCIDEKNAAKLHEVLSAVQKEADEKRIGMRIGSERYLFDPNITVYGSMVEMNGWVKWGINGEEVLDLVRYLKSIAEISGMSLCYDEIGFLLYGRYQYQDGSLTERYLPDEHYPDDNDVDNIYEKLDDALNKYGEDVYVGEV